MFISDPLTCNEATTGLHHVHECDICSLRKLIAIWIGI
jgi:hypothetical protein